MSWEAIPLSEIQPLPPVEPTIGTGGFVYPGARHVFQGEPESGKTLAGYAICLETIRAGGTVILADFEMGGRVARQRFRELGATDRELDRVLYVEPDRAPKAEELQALIAAAPTLAIFDAAAGAYDAANLDGVKTGDVERFARIYIKPFHKAGIATILIDHVTKAKDGRGRWSIGSERKLGGVDVALGFETITPLSRGGRGVFRIVTHKDRYGFLPRPRAGELELHSDPDTHVITWTFRPPAPETADSTGWRPTVLMYRVSLHLERQTEAVPMSHVEKARLGKSAETVRQAVAALVADGYVDEQKGAHGGRLLTSLKPYRDDATSSRSQTRSTATTSSENPDEDKPASAQRNLDADATSSDLVSPRLDEDVPTSSTSSPASRRDEDEVDDEDINRWASLLNDPPPLASSNGADISSEMVA